MEKLSGYGYGLCGIAKLIADGDDAHLKEAYAYGSGVRILRQDLWEMIVTFMISQNNNIKRITNSVDLLCRRCGHKIDGSAEGKNCIHFQSRLRCRRRFLMTGAWALAIGHRI